MCRPPYPELLRVRSQKKLKITPTSVCMQKRRGEFDTRELIVADVSVREKLPLAKTSNNVSPVARAAATRLGLRASRANLRETLNFRSPIIYCDFPLGLQRYICARPHMCAAAPAVIRHIGDADRAADG